MESGLPGYVVDGWFAALAPSKTPPRIVERLHADIAGALRTSDVAERLAAAGFEPGGTTPRGTAAFIDTEMKKWGKLIREANIKAD